MTDIFISYSQPDRDCAFALTSRLEQDGIGCWIAPRDIAPAADWAESIIDAISAARIMILVFSSSSNDSAQVRREVERAVHKQLHILPFRIEEVLPSKSLEYFLSAQHWMDAFSPPREAHYDRLSAYLRTHLLPGAAAPAPKPAPDASGTYAAIAARSALFQAADLRHFELQLAAYIGPLAKHLVKQGATRAASVDDLIGRLAVEIDSDADREQFMRRCRREGSVK